MSIQWDTAFPGGNGLLLDKDERARRPVLRFAAEPKNCPQALWFHFRLSGLDGPVRVVLANPEQTLGGWNWSADRPVWREPRGPWRRLGTPEKLVAPGGRVEWGWDIDTRAAGAEVAFCYPYQPADLAATLAELGGAFQQTHIGLSYANRQLPRVFSALPDPARPGVYITARHHAGETPGSWVLEGLLRHVAATSALRDGLVWWAAPFVDLDDVVEGSYGKDPYPHDCNRAYGTAGPRRPEGAAIEADVHCFKDGCKSIFFLDLHAPGHAEQTVYVPLRGWDLDAPINPMAQPFAEMFNLRQDQELRSPQAHFTPAAGANSRYAGLSSGRWAAEILKVDAVTVETSYQGNGRVYYDINDYRRLGAILAETVAEWMRRRG